MAAEGLSVYVVGFLGSGERETIQKLSARLGGNKSEGHQSTPAGDACETSRLRGMEPMNGNMLSAETSLQRPLAQTTRRASGVLTGYSSP
jgi:hypothetical protein